MILGIGNFYFSKNLKKNTSRQSASNFLSPLQITVSQGRNPVCQDMEKVQRLNVCGFEETDNFL